MSAHFAERRDVRADYTASGEQGLGNRQPKTLNEGGGEEQLAIPITPMHLRVRDSANERYSSKVCLSNISLDLRSLWSGHSHDKQSRFGIDDSHQQKAFKNLKNEKDVLVAPMLGNTQEKRFAIPTLGEGGLGSTRSRLDAVINRDCDSLIECCARNSEAEMLPRAFRNTCDCADRPQAFLQHHAVEEHLWKSEVCRYVVWIKIVQTNDRGTVKRIPFYRRRIGDMDDIRL